VDWDDLRYFLAAYRQRSLAGAGRELGCDYTTVGRRVAALETALGATLFARVPEGLAPTPAADDLAPLVEQMERASYEITIRTTGRDDRVSGRVRITCPEGFHLYVVGQIPSLRVRYPDLVVDVIADVRTLDLTRGEADLALRFGPTPQPDLLTRSLGELAWKMFASPAYISRCGVPTPLNDLREREVVGYGAPLEHVPGAAWLAEHGAKARVVFRGSTLQAILDATVAGLGLAVLPYYFASQELRVRLVAPDTLATRRLTLVVHRETAKLARVRAVIEFFADAINNDHGRGVFG
jgi:DNA-binding transcriptional LysR family regulator